MHWDTSSNRKKEQCTLNEQNFKQARLPRPLFTSQESKDSGSKWAQVQLYQGSIEQDQRCRHVFPTAKAQAHVAKYLAYSLKQISASCSTYTPRGVEVLVKWLNHSCQFSATTIHYRTDGRYLIHFQITCNIHACLYLKWN